MQWADLALPVQVVAATRRDGINGEMVHELQALLHGDLFQQALKVQSPTYGPEPLARRASVRDWPRFCTLFHAWHAPGVSDSGAQ